MVQQFIELSETIDWNAIGECEAKRRFQSSMAETLNCMTDLTTDTNITVSSLQSHGQAVW
ncbi:hypothetical protein [Synechococcus sp. UW105]|uniref:hypothetical protein n=1 Tax=Synechococcus sp. UW105 TaxID=337067 RepID=UPI000E0F4CD6|nr:hypothetical protein [Synechococcus sp. UW105]